MALEYGEIRFKPPEQELYREALPIPESFRMICTMNDFDKNLLLTELSYGLIRRFAFVPIMLDNDKEKEVVERRIKAGLENTSLYDDCKEQITVYFDFINDVRRERKIGVRTSIDVIKFLVNSSSYGNSIINKWESLNDALCDYVLPQFDRLDSNIFRHISTAAKEHLNDKAFEPFKHEVDAALQRLQRASGWFTNNGAA